MGTHQVYTDDRWKTPDQSDKFPLTRPREESNYEGHTNYLGLVACVNCGLPS